MKQQATPVAIPVRYSGNVLERRQRAAAEFMAWADHHAHDVLRQEALQVQVEGHVEQSDQRNALAQQQVYARRRNHQRQLHESAMAQLRHV